MSTAHVTPDSSATPTSRELSLVKNNAGTKGVSPSKSCFKPAATVFTQIGPEGIRFDFNDGCRVSVPIGDWRVCIRDFVTGNMLFETSTMVGSVFSSKKFYVPFEVEVWQGEASVFKHRLDLKDKNVLIQFPVGTLGDLVAWFPYAPIFAEKNQCNLTCAMGQRMIDLFAPNYPSIKFVTPEEVQAEEYYATYNIGLFFGDDQNVHQPVDFRYVGLHRTAAYILGVDPIEVPPKLALPDDSRPIPEKYVCIASQSTTQSKYWNSPGGWKEIVQFLKEHGYRVICIDQKSTHGQGLVWNHIPYGAEDQTGDKPLAERARWLKHADFFIGLSSGLSWLAWAAGTPVVMISGFTAETNEFSTPYRVINYHVCNSCWNDTRVRFDHADFLWCPRHANTPQQFECTRLITPEHVRNTIRKIPIFSA